MLDYKVRESLKLKSKNLIIKLLALLFFRSKGGVLNNFNSLISPKEYSLNSDLEMEYRANKLIDLVAPFPIVSPLKRVGSKNDGGYVISEGDLGKIDYLLSGGIEDNNSFEVEIAKMGITGIQIDNSITQPPIKHKNLDFLRATLGDSTNQGFSISRHLKSIKYKHILLKLDIEGAELEALEEIEYEIFTKIIALAVEIHNLDFIFDNHYWNKLEKVLNKIVEAGLVPCFVNPNNATGAVILGGLTIPRNIEITFTRRENIKLQPLISDYQYLKILQTKNKSSLANLNIDQLIFRRAIQSQFNPKN